MCLSSASTGFNCYGIDGQEVLKNQIIDLIILN